MAPYSWIDLHVTQIAGHSHPVKSSRGLTTDELPSGTQKDLANHVLHITNAGNVSIGAAIPSSEMKLDVYGKTQINDNLYVKKDLQFNGTTNKWVFATPDDGNTALSLAPRNNQDTNWNWGKGTEFRDNGDIVISGRINIGKIDSATSSYITIYGNNASDPWKSGIEIRNSDGGEARIIAHSDGMKFRTFKDGAHFYFRDNDNNTSMIIKDGGNVGIGTATPSLEMKLDVHGKAQINDNLYVNKDLYVKQDLQFNGTTNQWIFTTPDDGRTSFYLAPKNNQDASWDWGNETEFRNNGDIVISGRINIGKPYSATSSYMTINGNNSSDPWKSGIEIRNTDGGEARIVAHDDGMKFRTFKDGAHFYFRDNDNNTSMIIEDGGNVGIGTSTPQTKLAVNGIITAKEVLLTLKGWADYVFQKDYSLKTLFEVEEYIQTNKRLPGIPSEKEIKKKGIGIGEITTGLLAKIEELTLYTIDQEKKIKRQNELLTKQQMALNDLIKRVEQLEK